jgi:hypothetical protein
MSKMGPRLDWIAEQPGDSGVVELERLATAPWVTREKGCEASVQERAEALNDLKPHVSVEAAVESVEEIDRLISESHDALAA